MLDPIQAAKQAVQKEMQESQGSEAGYWLRLQPSRDLHLILSEIVSSDVLLDPSLTGNRYMGFIAMATTAGFGPQLNASGSGRDYLEIGRKGNTFLRVYEDGGILFTASLRDFWRPPQPRYPDPERLLWPPAVLEYPVSVFRIASKLYAESQDWSRNRGVGSLVAQLAVFNLAGWSLRPGSPQSWGFHPPEATKYRGKDLVLEPEVIPFDRLDWPDACGFLLIQRFYGAFGIPREHIPSEFDQNAGRLILPE